MGGIGSQTDFFMEAAKLWNFSFKPENSPGRVTLANSLDKSTPSKSIIRSEPSACYFKNFAAFIAAKSFSEQVSLVARL